MLKARGSLNRYNNPKIIQPVIQSKMQPLNLSVSSEKSDEIEGSGSFLKSHTPIITPRSEMEDTTPMLHSVSSTSFDITVPLQFDMTPLLSEVPENEFNALFSRKCRQCCQMCDFSNDQAHKDEKICKTLLLKEILDDIVNQQHIVGFSDTEYSVIYRLFSKNVIRTTPSPPEIWFSPLISDHIHDRVEESGWSHLSLVYDIIIAFVSHRRFNPNLAIKEVVFISKAVFHMFKSPDIREREKLTQLFHVFYRAFNKQRNILRNGVGFFLSSFLNASDPYVGISELLTALIPVVSGYKTPLHQEHLDFYVDCFLPLHRSTFLELFHPSLVAATTTYLTKAPSLVIVTSSYLRDHWPRTSTTKMVLLLIEIEALLPFIAPNFGLEVVKNIVMIVKASIEDDSFAVSEKGLMLWENENFMKLISSHPKQVYPIILPSIYKTASNHWCGDVMALAVNALRSLNRVEPSTFEDIGLRLKQTESEKLLHEMESGIRWKKLIEEHTKDQSEGESLKQKIKLIFKGCEELNEQQSNSSSPVINNNTPKVKGKLSSHKFFVPPLSYQISTKLHSSPKRPLPELQSPLGRQGHNSAPSLAPKVVK